MICSKDYIITSSFASIKVSALIEVLTDMICGLVLGPFNSS